MALLVAIQVQQPLAPVAGLAREEKLTRVLRITNRDLRRPRAIPTTRASIVSLALRSCQSSDSVQKSRNLLRPVVLNRDRSQAGTCLVRPQPSREVSIMEQETDRFVQAILIAVDPSQAALHQQALEYLSTVQQNVHETWRLALTVFVERDSQGQGRRYPPQARFSSLRMLDEFFDNR